MEKAGCKVDTTAEGGFFKVEHCHGKVAGGFRPDSGVVVCQNHVKSQQEVDNLLAHELIHAFDHCRVRDLDWNNCLHHTCSEVCLRLDTVLAPSISPNDLLRPPLDQSC